MIPSLLTFTLLAAVVLLATGVPLAAVPDRLEQAVRAFPRHRALGLATMILGGGWFLWKISQLGQADFGDYKNILLIIFGATLLGSIFYVPDFLAVRGVAILVLLSANTGLKSAFGLYDIPARLVLVTMLYIASVVALVYGVAPYKARDTVNWLFGNILRVRVLGSMLSIAGAALVVTSFAY